MDKHTFKNNAENDSCKDANLQSQLKSSDIDKFDKKIRTLIEEKFDSFIEDLSQIIKIKSISNAPKNGQLDDKNCQEALSKMLEICEKHGFPTRNIEGIVGHTTWTSKDTKPVYEGYFASLAHLDVVPAMEKWQIDDPYCLTKVDNKYMARGVLDDKGPAMCVLYAVMILRQLNIKPKRAFRMMFGTNEECGSYEIPTLIANEKTPKFTFTPDSEYPLTFAEKGIVNYKINTKFDPDMLNNLQGIIGDMHRNRVPSDITIKIADKIYSAKGVQAHAAWPFNGVNALVKAANMIAKDNELQASNKNIEALIEYFKWINDCFRWNHKGKNLGLDQFDFSPDPKQTFVVTPYKLVKHKDHISLYISVRYPVYITQDEITNKIFKTLEALKHNKKYKHVGAAIAGSDYEIVRKAPPAFTDVNDLYASKLLKAYRDVTGDYSDPVSSTGGSYAKHYPNTVAFGAAFQDRGHISGIAHNANEFMYIDDIKKNIEIYAHAIYNLVCEDAE